MIVTNQNVWALQMKCMVITSQMYSHYKSSYIQFLTLGGSHDHLYKLSKFPFLVGHMTHLSKHLIPLSVSTSKGKDVVRISLSPQAPWATLPLDVHLDFSHTCSSCGFREQTTEKLYFTSTGGHNTEKKIVYIDQPPVLAVLGSVHWGQGGLETNKNMLSTLQALVESTCHLPADNRLGTFQMFLQVPG